MLWKKVFNVNRIYTSLIIQTIPGEKKNQHIQLDSIWSNEGYFVNTIREIYSSAFALQHNIVWHDTNILYIEFTVLCWFIWWKNRKHINVFVVKYVEGNWKWKTNPITVLVRCKSHMWIDDDWLLMLFLILVYDVKMLCVCKHHNHQTEFSVHSIERQKHLSNFVFFSSKYEIFSLRIIHVIILSTVYKFSSYIDFKWIYIYIDEHKSICQRITRFTKLRMKERTFFFLNDICVGSNTEKSWTYLFNEVLTGCKHAINALKTKILLSL